MSMSDKNLFNVSHFESAFQLKTKVIKSLKYFLCLCQYNDLDGGLAGQVKAHRQSSLDTFNLCNPVSRPIYECLI